MNWIYKKSLNNKERYVLGEEGNKTLVCIGINPSTAEPNSLDNTLVRVKSRSLELGYDSWIMINVYPQRATNPDNLHKNIHIDKHRDNLKAIKDVLKDTDYDVWAAWGTLIEKRTYLKRCLRDITNIIDSSHKWFSVGDISIKGHPHHPLYLKNNLPKDSFDIKNYPMR